MVKAGKVIVARDNYSYKKYQRELTKKKKKEEKLLKKLNKKTAKDGEGIEVALDGQGPAIVETNPQIPTGTAGSAAAGPGQAG